MGEPEDDDAVVIPTASGVVIGLVAFSTILLGLLPWPLLELAGEALPL
jgi:hypothetical protein